MNVQLELPSDLATFLHPNPERIILESLLLRLVQQDDISVARAGEILGLSRAAGIAWYSSQGYPFPNLGTQDWADELGNIERLRG